MQMFLESIVNVGKICMEKMSASNKRLPFALLLLRVIPLNYENFLVRWYLVAETWGHEPETHHNVRVDEVSISQMNTR